MAMPDQPKRPARRTKAAPTAKTPLEAVLEAPAPNGRRPAAPKRAAAGHPTRRTARPARPARAEAFEQSEPAAAALEADVLNPGLRQELMENLESMIGRLRRLS